MPGCVAHQRGLQWYRHRLFDGLARSRVLMLLQMQGGAFRRRVVLEARAHLWSAGLAVPNLEFRQIGPAPVLESLYEIVAGRGLAVVPLEVKVRAGAELFRSQYRRQHADDLGALVVDSCRVEVRNLDIAVRPHGMGEWTCVLRELGRAKHAYILDALYRRA